MSEYIFETFAVSQISILLRCSNASFQNWQLIAFNSEYPYFGRDIKISLVARFIFLFERESPFRNNTNSRNPTRAAKYYYKYYLVFPHDIIRFSFLSLRIKLSARPLSASRTIPACFLFDFFIANLEMEAGSSVSHSSFCLPVIIIIVRVAKAFDRHVKNYNN